MPSCVSNKKAKSKEKREKCLAPSRRGCLQKKRDVGIWMLLNNDSGERIQQIIIPKCLCCLKMHGWFTNQPPELSMFHTPLSTLGTEPCWAPGEMKDTSYTAAGQIIATLSINNFTKMERIVSAHYNTLQPSRVWPHPCGRRHELK